MLLCPVVCCVFRCFFPSSLPLISSLIFGAITCVTGLLGVVIGAATTRLFRQKTERADPLVCAVSMLGSAIFICLIFVVAKKSIVGAYVRASRPSLHFDRRIVRCQMKMERME